MKEDNKNYIIFGPRVSGEMRETILNQFGGEEIPVDFGPFASGAVHCELFPFLRDERKWKTAEQIEQRYKENLDKLRGSKVVVVESTGEQPHVSDSLERVRSATSTLKKYGVREVTLAMANCAYDRQDRDFKEQGRFCSVNAEWLAKELKARGADHVITVAPHSAGTIRLWQNEFGKNYHVLHSNELFADDIKNRFGDLKNIAIGAPDGADKPNDQGQARAKELAEAVFGESEIEAKLFKIGKEHISANETKVSGFSGDVTGKNCVIIDDMSDGGGTLINDARNLKAEGAKSVTAYATHAICIYNEKEKKSGLEHLLEPEENGQIITPSPIDNVVLTDSIPEIVEKRAALNQELQKRVSIISVGSIISKEIERVQSLKKSQFSGRVPQWGTDNKVSTR